MLPAYEPGDQSRACGWMRAGIDGQEIRLADGSMEKYPAIARSRHGLFGLPWLSREDPDTIVFCEAWRDALTAISMGLFATASSGGASKWSDDWLGVFEGKSVYICMDADVAGQRAGERAAAAIVCVAKEVYVVNLPYEIKKSHGKDLHDYIVGDGHGRKFLLLLDKAKKYVADEVVECGDDVVILEDDHHDNIAAAFEEWSDVKHRHHIETWTVVENEKYRIVQEGEIKKWIRRFGRVCRLKKRKRIDGEMKVFIDPLKVTSHLVNGVLDALSALDGVWIQPVFVPPVFLSGGGDVEHIIAMDNCLLDIAGVEPQEMPLTENFYTLNYLPFAYDSGAKCPAWLKFLGEVFGKEGLSSTKTRWDDEKSDFVEVSECVPDEQTISILQEFMGLLVTCQTKYQKMLAIIGPKRSGKGTIGYVIRSLVGAKNATAPTLTSLTKEHGLWGLVNKTVAIIGDASISNRSGDVVRAVERLKSISGEDAQTINPKGGAYVDVEKLNVRFVLLANELQSLIDRMGALAGRLVYLNTTQSFIDREDIDLKQRLVAELPGIFIWALAGLKRLRDRGHFEETEAGRRARDMAERLGSPIIAFVREFCEEDPEYWVKPADLYLGYCKWADEANQGTKGRNRFYEDFERAFPNCPRVRERVWGPESNAVSVYKGIDLMAEYKMM